MREVKARGEYGLRAHTDGKFCSVGQCEYVPGMCIYDYLQHIRHIFNHPHGIALPACLPACHLYISKPRQNFSRSSANSALTKLVKGNRSLDGALIAHRLQALLPLIELERLVDDTVDLDLAAVEIVNRGREFVRLGEGAENGDFVTDCR